MTVDPRCTTFAALWLRTGGWTCELDVMKLAELVQEIAQDFEADLMNEYEKDCAK